MMHTIIYTGLSIPFNEAEKILPDATYLPPVKRGDILEILEKYDDIDIIGIIDGVFHQTPAVAHKEILKALKHDITVVGGASMGALRACELYPYGMIGVGNIFKDYKNEIIDSDDDVAVALDPDTLKPLSDSWINIKYNLEYATNDSIITHKQKDELLKIAKETYYPKRSFKYVIGKSNITNKDELLEYIKNKNFDIKYEDAKKTIEKIRKIKKY
ncbi:TfuA-related McrA-glycine thioamidation protein [uncultured Methanosphaera sp.]|nr:TfuA-related McrA-glycine thioamidation protein [Methanosphaera cuniculi]